MQKAIVWAIVLALLAALVYYFAFVYEKADYQHPMKRTSEIVQPINAA